MDDIFKTLSHDQMVNIEASLANDENSTDEELIEFFTDELGLTKEQAEHAVSFREQYFVNIFAEGQSPIFGEDNCFKFNPNTKDFEKS